MVSFLNFVQVWGSDSNTGSSLLFDSRKTWLPKLAAYLVLQNILYLLKKIPLNNCIRILYFMWWLAVLLVEAGISSSCLTDRSYEKTIRKSPRDSKQKYNKELSNTPIKLRIYDNHVFQNDTNCYSSPVPSKESPLVTIVRLVQETGNYSNKTQSGNPLTNRD